MRSVRSVTLQIPKEEYYYIRKVFAESHLTVKEGLELWFHLRYALKDMSQ